jgi:catechol 2,3-dioxygenase-like lactoylglutathione lyase family enzyme
MIDRIDHFVLTVADLGATLEFYERVLGFSRTLPKGRPAALLFGEQKINVHQADRTFDPTAARPTVGAGDFCLVTRLPITEVQHRIESLGVKIEVGPIEREGAKGRMISIYFRDPDHNLVEVAEYR